MASLDGIDDDERPLSQEQLTQSLPLNIRAPESKQVEEYKATNLQLEYRRKIRKKYIRLTSKMNEEQLLDPSSDLLLNKIRKGNKLFDNVTHAREAVLGMFLSF
jgi:hypothetical protein